MYDKTLKHGANIPMDHRMVEGGAMVEKQVDKHIRLYRAIQRMRSTNELLEALMARIEDRDPSIDESVPDHTPPLLDVLNNGAESIDLRIMQAEEQIKRLVDLLF